MTNTINYLRKLVSHFWSSTQSSLSTPPRRKTHIALTTNCIVLRIIRILRVTIFPTDR